MIRNYLKMALRNMLRYKAYTGINIVGLSMGIACCIFIFLFINDEWRYDKFHNQEQQIYRVTTIETEDKVQMHLAYSAMPVANFLKQGFPEIQTTVRYLPQSVAITNPKNNEVSQESHFFFTDSLFFELFSFHFLAGQAESALLAPNAVVLTQSTAKRYFGQEVSFSRLIGQSLFVEGEHDFTITGIVDNPPHNSSLQFDFIAAMTGARSVIGDWLFTSRTWHYPPTYTFVQIPDKTTAKDIASRMETAEKQQLSERLQSQFDFVLQPLEKVHFTQLEGDLEVATKPGFLYLLIGIALLILAIACINYINLSLSQTMQRFREFGMRKVLGAHNRQILQQMSLESFLFLSFSFVVALCIVQLGLGVFNQLIDKELSLFGTPAELWLSLLAVLFFVGITIAFFPYLAIARFKIIGILKAEYAKVNRQIAGFSFKNSFIVFQFTTAIVLIIATLVIQYQLHYIKGKDLGLKSEQVMVIPIRDEAVQNNFEAAKNTLKSIPGVVSVSAISNFPWEKGFYDFPSIVTGQGKSLDINLPTLLVAEDFIETLGMTIKEGRAFSQAFGQDKESAFLLNETAARQFGVEQIEGYRLKMQKVKSGEDKEGEIVGIIKDFHLKSLHYPIDPLVLTVAPETYFFGQFCSSSRNSRYG